MSVKMITLSDFKTIISQTTEKFDIIHTYINKMFFLTFWCIISVHTINSHYFQLVISLVFQYKTFHNAVNGQFISHINYIKITLQRKLVGTAQVSSASRLVGTPALYSIKRYFPRKI